MEQISRWYWPTFGTVAVILLLLVGVAYSLSLSPSYSQGFPDRGEDLLKGIGDEPFSSSGRSNFPSRVIVDGAREKRIAIPAALRSAGHIPGRPNGVIGFRTMSDVNSDRTDKGQPAGQLSNETLGSFGVDLYSGISTQSIDSVGRS